MARRHIHTQCYQCGAAGWRHEYAWVSHADLCWPCMRALEASGMVRGVQAVVFELTDLGAARLPALAEVAQCAWDGSPIYRRWVEDGSAVLHPQPECPACRSGR